MKPQENASALEHSDLLTSRLIDEIKQLAQNDFGVDLELNIISKRHLDKIVIPNSTGFSKENVQDIRYAAFENSQQKFYGLKISGTDWTAITCIFQDKMYNAEFANENIEEWAKSFVEELKTGEYDEHLVFTRKLVKKVEEYTGNLPPHVKAAKLLEKPGKVIKYLMTTRGPVPAELSPNDIDYQYYLDKQLAPIADSLLELKNLQFENLFKAQQLNLFDF